MKIWLTIVLITCFLGNAFCQEGLTFFQPSDSLNTKRAIAVGSLQLVGYGTSLALLSNTWYKNYSHTKLHSFDDFPEWLQMDKAGHLMTAWYLGRIGTDMFEWSGLPGDHASNPGCGLAFDYLIGIELLDGFSNGWGFSWSDLGADYIGGVMIYYQKRSKGRSSFGRVYKNISLKYSFHQTGFPQYRPSLLGENLGEQLLKDYNGQSYWLSFNLSSFMKKDAKFPKWLNVAMGYGAEGMISGRPGYVYTYPSGNTVEFERYRQYYLSLDIDLTKIKTRSHFLKTVFEAFSFIKIPAPALEFSKKGTRFHPFYY